MFWTVFHTSMRGSIVGCMRHFCMLTRKNPAYGRQSISRPMRIIAPMPKEGGPRIPKNPIIHREAWFPPCFVEQNQQKKTFFARQWGQWAVGAKRPLNVTSKVKKVGGKNFFCAAIFDNFQTKMFLSEITLFHYFSPRIPNL